MYKSLLFTSLLLNIVVCQIFIKTFSSSSKVPWMAGSPKYPLTDIENDMNLWLKETQNVIIMDSGLTRSDDESAYYYTGYFLYKYPNE